MAEVSTLMDEFGHDDDPNDRGRQGDTRPRRAAGPSSRQRKRGMSPFTAVGLLLLIAGLASLGWVAYQYFGTNIVADALAIALCHARHLQSRTLRIKVVA